MNEREKASRNLVVATGFEFMRSGDVWVYHEPNGNEKSFCSVDWSNAQARAEGLEIFGAGVENQEEYIVVCLKSYLVTAGISKFDPAGGYLKRQGVRWDFQVDRPISVHGGPGDDTSNLIWFTVRKAVEQEHTVPGSDFQFRVD